jgi:hypothetical protein
VSEEAKKFHEEEAIEKTYDLRVTLRCSVISSRIGK